MERILYSRNSYPYKINVRCGSVRCIKVKERMEGLEESGKRNKSKQEEKVKTKGKTNGRKGNMIKIARAVKINKKIERQN